MKKQLFATVIMVCLAVIAGAEEPRTIPEAIPTEAESQWA